ncbi:MAG: cysteine desulfurase family protein [Sphaerochaeta sp.]|jgi:cysteine desulfurase|uniref:cysteine desulfurase n=2 Tax=root TaxID=1 RepID=A0ABY4DCS4_9SPIR|nr:MULTISPECIES: cysteine desulfurase family protein [Sphaerochaeta]MDT3359601.1 cysteine desulfurase [Spirochaetota bacterium]NLA98417.1 cysteine desulfurase [Spirochaetales bacterium]MDD2394190.1 cysteine desulfurase family protein [Sphaerochaeta sp.]MDD4037221.1 cysteine desulfurase family protein [Sphaerochaeta sp.]MDX9983779.1 cysteine desulfurase family protein [Sphaerochaeta sp.]
MEQNIIYLDNNATTAMHEDVIEAVHQSNMLYGNASSMHMAGRQAALAIEQSRQALASLIDEESSSIVFTSGASEANNTVFNIFKERIDLGSKRNRIVTTTIEHPSIIETVKYLRQLGYNVDECPVDSTGRVKMDVMNKLLGDDVALVSVMLGNNEIGTIQPVAEIARLAHQTGAFMHTDATQAIGKIPVSMRELGVDYLSLSAHKFYGPKGVGALVVKAKAPYAPLVHGGHQEGGKRAGTYNTASIVGMGVAASIAQRDLDMERKKLWKLREMLRVGILERISNVVVNGNQEHCLPGTLDVSFPHAEGESILLYLDMEGIMVSTGSACASGSLEPSYVLLASGVDIELAHGSIRFSFGRYNTEQDVAYVLEKLPPIIKRLREMSTR